MRICLEHRRRALAGVALAGRMLAAAVGAPVGEARVTTVCEPAFGVPRLVAAAA